MKIHSYLAVFNNLFHGKYTPGEVFNEYPNKQAFGSYLFKGQKHFNIIVLCLIVIQFIVYKIMYPFPDFFSDSYSYIYAATAHLDVNIWPIGYSKFLLFFHWFTHSAFALNCFQYFFLELSALYFYHSLIYIFPTGKYNRIFLFIFLFFNPLNFYLANYVTSDAIFIGLSLIWITQLIWIIYRPRPYQLFVQAFLFIIAFTFRYNAIFYPVLAGVAFFLSKQRLSLKIIGTLLGPVLMIAFILFSREATYKMVGTAQFPPILGGWQWANNALYMREFIDVDSTAFPTMQTAELDRMARTFFRTVPKENRDLPNYVANFFIRQGKAPLKLYMHSHYMIKSDYENVMAWGLVAPIYGQYGLYLIKQHPLAYLQHFMLVNTKNYFLPPLEKLEIYNLGQDTMWPVAAYWFDYQDLHVTSINKYLQNLLLIVFTPLFLVLNIFYLINLIRFMAGKYYQKENKTFSYSIFLVSLFLGLNFAFSVFANIIVMRYQIFPMAVLLSSGMILLDYLILVRQSPSGKKSDPFLSIQISVNKA